MIQNALLAMLVFGFSRCSSSASSAPSSRGWSRGDDVAPRQGSRLVPPIVRVLRRTKAKVQPGLQPLLDVAAMSARWDREDFWPEVDYSEPPYRQRVDWFVVAAWTVTTAASLLVWSLILWLVWSQVS